VALFLASDDSSFVTGIELFVGRRQSPDLAEARGTPLVGCSGGPSNDLDVERRNAMNERASRKERIVEAR